MEDGHSRLFGLVLLVASLWGCGGIGDNLNSAPVNEAVPSSCAGPLERFTYTWVSARHPAGRDRTIVEGVLGEDGTMSLSYNAVARIHTKMRTGEHQNRENRLEWSGEVTEEVWAEWTKVLRGEMAAIPTDKQPRGEARGTLQGVFAGECEVIGDPKGEVEAQVLGLKERATQVSAPN